MSRRSYSPNALEPTLLSLITGGSASIALDSVTGLTAPGYMCIDPDDPTKREYFKFTNINGSALEGLTRGLTGSALGAVGHDAQAPVRQVFTSQALDDIFADVEDLEAVDSAHIAAGDPHPSYLQDSLHTKAVHDNLLINANQLGGNSASAFSLATHTHGDAGVPSGTRMIFDQDSAPVGWTRDTSTVDDRMIMIVTGSRGPNGGTWSQTGHTHGTSGGSTGDEGDHSHSSPQHAHNVLDHTHPLPNHQHGTPNTGAPLGGGTATAQENGGSNFEYNINSHTHAMGNTDSANAGPTNPGGNNTQSNAASNTGNDGTHSHSVDVGATDPGATSAGWRPLHRDMIIAVKD
jgi:hypothetical protein